MGPINQSFLFQTQSPFSESERMGLGAPEGIWATPRPLLVHPDCCSEMLLGHLREPLGEQGLGSSPKPGCHLAP